MPHLSVPQPHDQWGAYRLLFPLGQGGMASVFVAEAEAGPHKGQRVACKILLPHLRADERWVAQLFAEAETTAAITDRHVIRVLDIPQDREAGFFVMEWRQGLPLDRLLAKAGKLPLPLACAVLAQTARGLDAVHAAADAKGKPLHIVHRDVSPHNIHVGTDGVVKLLDFGISAAEGHARLTRTGEFKGKLAYVAPEQITRSHVVDFRCDLWALGVVAYEVLTGRCLFSAADEGTTLWNVTAAEVPSLAALGCVVEPGLAQMIEACLQRDPALRPSRAKDIAEALEAFAAEPLALALLVGPQPPLLVERQRKAASRKLWFVGGAVATAAAIAWITFVSAGHVVSAPPSATRQVSPQGSPTTSLDGDVDTVAPLAKATRTAGTKKPRAAARLSAQTPAAVKGAPALVPNPYKDLVDNPY